MRVSITRTDAVDGVRYKRGTRPVVSDEAGAKLCELGLAVDVTDQHPSADLVIEPHSVRHLQIARH